MLHIFNKYVKPQSLNIPFKFDTNKKGKRFYTPYGPSIDRIDSNKGYTKDNVRLVLVSVNIALNNFGEGVFETICRAYLSNKDNLEVL